MIGVYGERYDLGSLAADGTRTLTITLNPLTDGYNQTIVINNWKQGDYGIQIQQFSYGQGLDSGTNKNGQLGFLARRVAGYRSRTAGRSRNRRACRAESEVCQKRRR